jgi:O-acetyl-ADP-ribose deacetylase (regulator of RNase III)
VRYEKKDITTVTAPGIIAHGVNCQNTMGSGVAKALYTKWPLVKKEYHEYGSQCLGDVQVVQVELGLVVANCFTQKHYGYAKRRYANVVALCGSLTALILGEFVHDPIEIHIPRIGCDRGGLDWDKDVAPVLEALEAEYRVTFVVCDL